MNAEKESQASVHTPQSMGVAWRCREHVEDLALLEGKAQECQVWLSLSKKPPDPLGFSAGAFVNRWLHRQPHSGGTATSAP